MARKIMLLIALLAVSTSESGNGAAPLDRIGESCVGRETVKIGAQPVREVSYSLELSVDFATRRFCYGACGAAQSFAVADSASTPVKLVATGNAGQSRFMTLDRRSGALVDDQAFDGGLAHIVRHATAVCSPSTYHEPSVD